MLDAGSLPGPAADIKVTTSDLRSQVGRIQNQVKEIQEVVRMYSSTTGPRRVRRQKMEIMSAEAADTNVRTSPHPLAHARCRLGGVGAPTPAASCAAILAADGAEDYGSGKELRAHT